MAYSKVNFAFYNASAAPNVNTACLPFIAVREPEGDRVFVVTFSQRFSNFFQVGTTFISQNVLRTTLLLGLSNSLGLP